MTDAVMVVRSRPTPGREDEYNRWYDKVHIPDVLTIPGFVAAQRYVLADADTAAELPYLAVYEIEGDGPQAVADLFAAGFEMSDALDDHMIIATYRTLGARQTRA